MTEKKNLFWNLAIAHECIMLYLIGGLKFDFRVYVLVTPVDPLRVYVYKEELTRLCNESYENTNQKNLGESHKFTLFW